MNHKIATPTPIPATTGQHNFPAIRQIIITAMTISSSVIEKHLLFTCPGFGVIKDSKIILSFSAGVEITQPPLKEICEKTLTDKQKTSSSFLGELVF